MTKEDLLNLLESINSENAGKAIAFVEGLSDNDVRFARSFPGDKAEAAIGYWLWQEERSGKKKSQWTLIASHY